MDARAMRSGFCQAAAAFRAPAKRRVVYCPRRCLATNESHGDIRPAQPFEPFEYGSDFIDNPANVPDDLGMRGSKENFARILPKLRIVPASPSYFTAKPEFTDALLVLETLQRKHHTLPVLPPGQAPRVAWRTLAQYKVLNAEPVKAARYRKIVQVLQRLNYIHPSLMPAEVKTEISKYMRDVQPFENRPKPVFVDQWGRARGVGRRKSSHAVAFVVEGEGEVLINGQSLTQTFGRIHDRESAVWALKSTERMDKYNVWAVVKGGGCTGQAEALTLAVAKALMVHEPDLKPALRRAGCVTRDPRRVERKKPGKLKARKMPAWVKR